MELASLFSTFFQILWQFGMQQWAYQEADETREDQQAFQKEREDIAYARNANQKVDQYDRFLSLGINPNLAADSILGNTGSQPAQALSSPSAPTPLSTMGALNSIFGNMQDTIMNSEKRAAEVENIRADTDKKNVETGLMPRDYQLRLMSTTAQIRSWNESADLAAEQAKLTKEQTDLVKQQNFYYGRLSEAEIKSYQGRTAEAYANAKKALEQVNTEQKQQEFLDSEIAVNRAEIQNLNADTSVKYQEAYSIEVKTEREKICRDFETALGGVPLTADAQKYVQKLVNDGDLDGIHNFYQTIYSTALNQKVGEQNGTGSRWGLPFGIYQGAPNVNPLFMQPGLTRARNSYWVPSFVAN